LKNGGVFPRKHIVFFDENELQNSLREIDILKQTLSGLVKNRLDILAQIVPVFKKCAINIHSVAVEV
jgi:hypothetical protein